MFRPRLLIRADASAEMGTGHIMRCLALAQAWQDHGGEVSFVMAQASPALKSRIISEGMAVVRQDAPPGSEEDARQTAVLAREGGAEWVVVDGYQFGSTYQRLIKEERLSLLFVDDYGHADHYWADLILNQNIYAYEDLYANRELYARLLLGTRYVMLRREFRRWRSKPREIPAVGRKVLVTLGGGDPDNITGKVLQSLGEVNLDSLEAVVLVGGANPNLQELKAQVAGLPFLCRLATNVSDVPELMAWADAAITAGGSTCWELTFMGIPGLIIILADNQRPIAERLTEVGAAINLGWYQDLESKRMCEVLTDFLLSQELRTELCRRNQTLVDGQGAIRVRKEMLGAYREGNAL